MGMADGKEEQDGFKDTGRHGASSAETIRRQGFLLQVFGVVRVPEQEPPLPAKPQQLFSGWK